MARTKEMAFAASATINMGGYESLKFDYSEVIELKPGDDVAEVREKLRKRVKHVLEDEILEARREKEQSERSKR